MKYFFVFLFSIASIFTIAQDSLIIKGVLKGQGNQRISLSIPVENSKPDNYLTTAVNDVFTLKIKKQKIPVAARLTSGAVKQLIKTANGRTYGNPAPPLDIFVYQSDLTIDGDVEFLHLASVKGDKENDEYSKLKKETEADDKKEWDLRTEMFSIEENDSLRRKQIMEEVTLMSKRRIALQKEFVNNNPGAFASLFLLSRIENMYTTGDYENAFNNLTDDYKQTELAQKIAKRIEYLSPTSPGKPAINFTRKEKDGKEIKLSDYKGQMVLIDFWGSWCGPCRASHPHLKQLYAKYKDKGFEIIAIADEKAKTPEEQKSKWLEAIKKDGISWVHILNNEGKDKQDLVRDYRVTAFPTKLLLDKDGKILLRITASATNDIEKALEKEYGF